MKYVLIGAGVIILGVTSYLSYQFIDTMRLTYNSAQKLLSNKYKKVQPTEKKYLQRWKSFRIKKALKRPVITEYMGDGFKLDKTHKMYLNNLELWNYIQALDEYCDNLESKLA